MNKKNYFPSTKNCATCNNWVGNRELSANQKCVIASPDEIGTCFGKYRNTKKHAKDIGLNCWVEFNLLHEDYDKQTVLQNLQQIIAEIQASESSSVSFYKL